ncbi:MAG TPA: alpha/beta-hydrolase family protein [Candidatus Corynebacterium avicola]|uniref:Alpha/beta-hydrolase family protein n=1 Tax=Candidatus Corynebacterium avicola TaxID=2838527 RepID=A0A9D1RPQ6_9CORY|nr:alpha/beta-hydrolase family protein [Candidatus Corynebacterium avicola]
MTRRGKETPERPGRDGLFPDHQGAYRDTDDHGDGRAVDDHGVAPDDTDASEAPETSEKIFDIAWGPLLDRYRKRLSFTGMLTATVFLFLSMSTSLLPRGAMFQGLISGAAAALGYMLGVGASWLFWFMLSKEKRRINERSHSWLWWVPLGVVALVGTVFMLRRFRTWQNEIRAVVDVDPLGWSAYVTVPVIAVLVFAVLMLIGQGWGLMTRTIFRAMNRIIPPRISAVASGALMVVLTMFLANGVIATNSMKVLNTMFAATNTDTKKGTERPSSETRSGSPDSLVSWESLGREGRSFVAKGPTVEELEDFNDTEATEPVRTFVGMQDTDADLRENAELAAEELVRAGGLDREVIAIGSATGSGWINQATVDSLEYMYNGDVATVSMQYSYLPSWLSFLVDSERARQAGTALFEAVDAKVQELPERKRPEVVVFGESLGSFGAEAAFGTVPTLSARTDGALFVGPTFNNELWQEIVTHRDAGSRQRLPVYEDGENVRFMSETDDLENFAEENPEAEWERPRTVYLQHSSDPITFWSPSLILERPDWMEEPAQPGTPDMTWLPFISFLQLSADMAVSLDVPDGYGHNYVSGIPVAWAEILEPDGWTDEKTEELIPLLSR